MDLTDREREIRADAIERLVKRIHVASISSDGPGPPGWWNNPSEMLGGRTPVEAWRDGDEVGVREWIAEGYRKSEAAAERFRADPASAESIERRARELHAAH
jgi:hypothetical protein